MSDLVPRIAENLDRVRRRIAESAAKSGRTPEQITLVAVTKYVGEFESRAVFEAGCEVLLNGGHLLTLDAPNRVRSEARVAPDSES